MKQIFAILMLIAVLNQTFNVAFCILNLHLKKQEINSEICSKTHQPTLRCQGVCDLLNKLKTAHEDEKKALEQQFERDLNIFSPTTSTIYVQSLAIPPFESLIKNFTYVSLAGGLWRNRILRPPSFC